MSDPAPAIRPARPDEAETLSALAMRSKAHWGYSPDFIERCRIELTVEASDIAGGRFVYRVADLDGTAIGYYALELQSPAEFELEALFVEPDYIGRGVGRQLMQHALRTATGKGARKLRIQGDPNATQFYEAAGGRRIGELESFSIPGRFLPLYEISLPPEVR